MPESNDRATGEKIVAALRLARQGTDYFRNQLAALDDAELDAPSLLPGWSRRHVIAHVAYNARGLNRLAGWAATGVEQAMYESREKRDAEIEAGAVLPAAELRKLAETAAERLDASWREMSDVAWQAEVRTWHGVAIPASTTVWMRTREVWLHAIDLDAGAWFTDFPADLLDHLMADVLSVWRSRRDSENIPNFVLVPDDRDTQRSVGDAESTDAVVLRGSSADLVGWATGRSTTGVLAADGAELPEAPRWL